MKKTRQQCKVAKCLDIFLDEHKYYFSGDLIKGRLVLSPLKLYKITGIRLEFFGRVKVNVAPKKKQDGHYLFKELVSLDDIPGVLNGSQTYTFPFEFQLPANDSLPSSTECDTKGGGIVEYMISATMERPARETSITASIHIPVLDRIDTHVPELLVPVQDKLAWQSQYQEDIIDEDDYHGFDQAVLSAIIPHQGYTRDQRIPVTVEIQHFQPYQRTNGLCVSLIQSTQILCDDKSYFLSPVIIDSVKLNIDVRNTFGQTVNTELRIPKHISPTINRNAVLLQLSYHIELRAEMDEATNHTESFSWTAFLMDPMKRNRVNLASMRLELPVVIGTLPSLTDPPSLDILEKAGGQAHQHQRNRLLSSLSVSSAFTPWSPTSPTSPVSPASPVSPTSKLAASFSSLTSKDLFSLPSTLLEATSTSFRWDHSSLKRASNLQQYQHQGQQSSSSHMQSSSPARTTSLSALSQISQPVYRNVYIASDTQPPSASASLSSSPLVQSPSGLPFYLPLSLGEPFHLFTTTTMTPTTTATATTNCTITNYSADEPHLPTSSHDITLRSETAPPSTPTNVITTSSILPLKYGYSGNSDTNNNNNGNSHNSPVTEGHRYDDSSVKRHSSVSSSSLSSEWEKLIKLGMEGKNIASYSVQQDDDTINAASSVTTQCEMELSGIEKEKVDSLITYTASTSSPTTPITITSTTTTMQLNDDKPLCSIEDRSDLMGQSEREQGSLILNAKCSEKSVHVGQALDQSASHQEMCSLPSSDIRCGKSTSTTKDETISPLLDQHQKKERSVNDPHHHMHQDQEQPAKEVAVTNDTAIIHNEHRQASNFDAAEPDTFHGELLPTEDQCRLLDRRSSAGGASVDLNNVYDKPHERSPSESEDDSDEDEEGDFLSMLARRENRQENGYWK